MSSKSTTGPTPRSAPPALGANPISGYAALIDGAFGGWDQLADTAIKAMPLLLVGVGICIAFRA